MVLEIIKNDCFSIWIKDEILSVDYTKATIIDLELAKKVVSEIKLLTQGKTYPTIVNFTNIKEVSRDARIYLGSAEACRGILAVAIIINSPVQAIIGNFFLKFQTPVMPLKLFVKQDLAVQWLKSFDEE